jgi:hypothetical protein
MSTTRPPTEEFPMSRIDSAPVEIPNDGYLHPVHSYETPDSDSNSMLDLQLHTYEALPELQYEMHRCETLSEPPYEALQLFEIPANNSAAVNPEYQALRSPYEVLDFSH